ncbi:DUF6752 domain-containing protein [Nocardioides coralli]|uniref:DUF6752 domain-containing protein n=1 Tax=Nocardioides coralli TaxID=2872154 RepID=UPI001CA39188|nr:DUF6752 domain-containing protein [Nocardioides coralli]QZY30044.1 hypothetical protein K6T13_04995 [Nocardioides coralli]
MTRRVYMHVGSPKSGTTYLQRVLRHNRDGLAEQGVLVAGRTHVELVHAGFVVREDARLERLPERAHRAWDRVVEQVHDFPGDTAIISYELLAGARRRQARAALARFDGLETHVVVTTRDLGRAVSSAWQERLKFALDVPLGQWQPPGESLGPRAEWGWRTMDPASVADRWGADLPVEQVHVVTAPRGGPPRELWDRFAAACDLLDIDIDLAIPPANESLGAKAAEVLRKVNEQELGPIRGAREQSRWLRDTLAHGVLAGLDDEPMGITEAQLAEAEARARAAVARIREAGWQVHGDLDDVTATRRDGRLPEEVPAEELLDVAVRTIARLLLELREASLGAAPADDTSAAERLRGSVVVDVRGRRARAVLDDLTARLGAAEKELQDGRRLHERVAALTDLVNELLVPTAQQDGERLRQALRTYRSESL